MYRPVLSILLIFCASTGFSQEKWDLKRNENGIEVYTRKTDSEKFKEIRVVCEFRANFAQLIKTLQQVQDHYKWSYATRKAYMLKQDNPYKFIYYSEIGLPWPLSNRDAITRIVISVDSVSNVLSITGSSMPDFVPEKKGLVRTPYSLAVWKVKALPDNRLAVDYTFSVDPGGSLPAWFVNMASSTGPYTSFMKLRDIVQNQKL
ncbi:START domain-containing protein [Hufsiella ginkgonis]|uniref:START domain-containing protein n=1 Tax=Hufsiella ginkgonis TaxID=2695274 RepID=A0A7K1XXH9_9SPHI|nr:START domain-containing protein [Hufsiella ginkgonis]MXV15714.1 hypothetical protein [Hufsiella ginkgonis]